MERIELLIRDCTNNNAKLYLDPDESGLLLQFVNGEEQFDFWINNDDLDVIDMLRKRKVNVALEQTDNDEECCCGACQSMESEDTSGYGFCRANGIPVYCSDTCQKFDKRAKAS